MGVGTGAAEAKMTLGASGMSQAESGHVRQHNGPPHCQEDLEQLQLPSPQGIAPSQTVDLSPSPPEPGPV